MNQSKKAQKPANIQAADRKSQQANTPDKSSSFGLDETQVAQHNGAMDGQVALLQRLHPAQRVAMLRQMTKTHGNAHIGRIVARTQNPQEPAKSKENGIARKEHKTQTEAGPAAQTDQSASKTDDSTDERGAVVKQAPHVQRRATNTDTIQRFEAKHHESAERHALTEDGAMTQEEAGAVYMGNWMRDFNQAFVPLMEDVLPQGTRYALLKYIALKKFGRTMSSEQLGYYIMSEHIDNPAGQLDTDLLSQQPDVEEQTVPDVDPIPDKGLQDQATPQETIDPAAQVNTALDTGLFSVDESGVMAFIRRTNEHIENRLNLATRRGRTPEGMMHFGAALHAVEDLFAHSNWIEIAVSKTLKDNPQLLASQLQGDEREVFDFAGEVNVPDEGGKQEARPVLTTGTFTTNDSIISIGHELTHVLKDGLYAEPDKAIAIAQDHLMIALLRAYGYKKMANVYEYTRAHLTPEFVAKAKNEAYSILNPRLADIAAQIEAALLEQNVSETSLLAVQETNQEIMAGGTGDPTTVETLQQNLTGKSVKEQRRENKGKARAQNAALANTPDQVVAGPSHSQISKDHANSIFFGLAFKMATEAIKRIRDQMLQVWAEGGDKQPYDKFTSPKDGRNKKKPLTSEETYDETEKNAKESADAGASIVAEGHAKRQSYDLEAMRNESAKDINSVAFVLSAIVQAPSITAKHIGWLKAILGDAIDNDSQAKLEQLEGWAFRSGNLLETNADLIALAASLGQAEGLVRSARTYDERLAANEMLKGFQQELISQIEIVAAGGNASKHEAALGVILTVLNRVVASTSVSYLPKQRQMLNANENPLKVEKFKNRKEYEDQPIDQKGISATQSDAFEALVGETRQIVNHPYESDWWVSSVLEFINENGDQLANEVKARNSGYAGFRGGH